MTHLLNSFAFGQFIAGEDDKKFYNQLWEQGNDMDRPGAEGVYDLPHIYYDYYFNDERRWDNEGGWNSDDSYFNPDMFGKYEQYDDLDIEEWEIQQEYEANYDYSPAVSPKVVRASNNWEYFAERLKGLLWRDLNT